MQTHEQKPASDSEKPENSVDRDEIQGSSFKNLQLTASPSSLSQDNILKLQRTIGNQAVIKLLKASTKQNSVSYNADRKNIQRYINPLSLDDIFGEEEFKQGLLEKIQKYNNNEDKLLKEHDDFYSSYDIPLPWINKQLEQLEDIEVQIQGKLKEIDEEEKAKGIADKSYNKYALTDLQKNIDGDRSRLQQKATVIKLSNQYSFDPKQMFKLYHEGQDAKLLTEIVEGATKSEHLGKIMSKLSTLQNIPSDIKMKLFHLNATNMYVRQYISQLNTDDEFFDPTNLEELTNDIEQLEYLFEFLIKTRKLPEEIFNDYLDKSVLDLVSGEDYQEVASHLSMKLPKPVTLLEIADEFTRGMKKLGYTIFLSGGGSITFRGGTRPIADLDFRVDPKQGLTSFSSFHGKQLLKMANRILEISSNKKEKGINYSNFSAMGKKAMTIATYNWFNIEVSLSINQAFSHEAPEKKEFKFHSEEYIQNIDPEAKATKSINLLTLNDLLRDKLKTVISRTKEGETSFKKVAQDLFDILTVVKLLQDKGINVLDKKGLSEHLEARVEQYRIQNLEPPTIDMTELDVENVIKLMLYRLVKTAQLHLVEGDRHDQFWKLAAHSSMDIMPLLEELAGIPISSLLTEDVKEFVDNWFENWNKEGATFEEITKIPAKNQNINNLQDSPDAPEVFPQNALVTEILETAPPELDIQKDEICILYILYKSVENLRPLDNSHDAIEVMAAFSHNITVRGFSRFYDKFAKKENYVRGTKAGLKLLPAGKEFIKDKIDEANM